MLKCRGCNPCPEHVSPVTTHPALPAEKPDITELERISKGRKTGCETVRGLPVKQFTRKAEMLRALASHYKPGTLGTNLCIPRNIKDKGKGSMNAHLVCNIFLMLHI